MQGEIKTYCGYLYDDRIVPNEIYCDAGLISEEGKKQSNPSYLGCTVAVVKVYRHPDRKPLITSHWHNAYLCSGVPNYFDMFNLTKKKSINSVEAEILALYHAMRDLPEGWEGTFFSDCQAAIGCIFGFQGKPWSLQNIDSKLAHKAILAKERLGEVSGVLIGGHPTIAEMQKGTNKSGFPVSPFNCICHEKCQQLSKAYRALHYFPDREVIKGV